MGGREISRVERPTQDGRVAGANQERLAALRAPRHDRRREDAPLERRVGRIAVGRAADQPAVRGRQPDGAASRPHDPSGSAHHLREHAVEVGHGGELARQLEERLRALGLAPLRLVESRVHERDRHVAREHLEEPEVVRVELVEPELRDDDHADHGGAVEERHGEEGLLDLVGARDPDADRAMSGVARQERLAGRRDVSGDAVADARREQVHRRSRGGEIAAEGDRPQVVALADEHAAVVVVDQEAQLVGDRRADRGHVVEPAELRRDAVEHLQVRDRAELGAAVGRPFARALRTVLLEDDDHSLPAGLRGHHRHLGARDQLPRVGGVRRARGDPDREADRADRAERRDGDLLLDPLGEPERVGEAACRHDDRELLAADPAHRVARAHGREEDRRDLGEDVIAGRVAVHVVDALEVVEIEHHERHGRLVGRGDEELLPEPLVERAVVPEARQRVGLGLVLERRADVRVVDRERSRVGEPDDEPELVFGELLVSGAIDVQRSLQAPARGERNSDQRLGIGRRVRHEADARVQLRAVREHGLAVLGRPAGDPDAVRERRVREHLLRVAARRVHRPQLALRLVRLVEGDVVVRDELADRARDSLEEVVQRLLGEDLVEHVRELSVRLDERVERLVGGLVDVGS